MKYFIKVRQNGRIYMDRYYAMGSYPIGGVPPVLFVENIKSAFKTTFRSYAFFVRNHLTFHGHLAKVFKLKKRKLK